MDIYIFLIVYIYSLLSYYCGYLGVMEIVDLGLLSGSFFLLGFCFLIEGFFVNNEINLYICICLYINSIFYGY